MSRSTAWSVALAACVLGCRAAPREIASASRETPRPDASPPELRRLEKSELFYAVGDEVFKVTLHAVSSRGAHAATAVRCSKKGGSARDFERMRVNCPGRPWSRVTQSDGRCP